IGAMLCTSAIYNAIADGSGFFQHGHTYVGHPAAAAGGLAVVSAILERGLIDRVLAQGGRLRQRLQDVFGQHAHVGDIRGRGLFRGIELVEDRGTKAPFNPSKGVAAKIKKAAFAEGLICYPMAGTIDGRRGDHILLAPPFIIEDDQIDELTDKLDRAIGAVI
ncbi:MAG: aminotransferase class III-fold pyridoxal phosphate-dependent enzyme, partial [Pseudomonadota bacterium]